VGLFDHKVLGFDLNTRRCGAALTGSTLRRFRFEPEEHLSPMRRCIQVKNWSLQLIEEHSPDLIAIETYGEFGPTQSLMASLIAPIEQEVVEAGYPLLRMPANDLTYFIKPAKKVGKSERVVIATNEGIREFEGLRRLSHDEADAFFLCIAGCMVVDAFCAAEVDEEWLVNRRHILFSRNSVKHGLRGLVWNPERYVFLDDVHEALRQTLQENVELGLRAKLEKAR